MFIVSLNEDEWESYNNVRSPRFEKTDQSHMWGVVGKKGHKMVCISGKLQIKRNRKIFLKNLLILYCLESDLAKDFDVGEFRFSLKNKQWNTTSDNHAKIVTGEGFFSLNWRQLDCPNCGRPVLLLILGYNASRMKRWMKNIWCHDIASKKYGFLHAYKVKTKGEPDLAKELLPEKVAEILMDHKAVVLTGAGVSLASGIPTFGGPNGLCTRLKLFQKDFPDELFHLLIEKPQFIAHEIAFFKTGFIRAKPNPAHFALADLQHKGFIGHIITENLDALHQRAGSVKVIEIGPTQDFKKHFSEDGDGWEILRMAGVLIVMGIGSDEHGLIEYARDYGAKVLAISPNRPNFLTAKDFYLAGVTEVILPEISNLFDVKEMKLS